MKRFLTACVAAIIFALPVWAAEMGDDGLHKTHWMRDTFKDLREDLSEANAEGKRFVIIIEQRGCIYCKKMHEEVFPDAAIDSFITDNYFVVQLNMFGDVEVTDFDGDTLTEKEMVRKWGLMFTPTMMFFPEEVAEGLTAQQAAVSVVPGAFGKGTTLAMLHWVKEKGYDSDEPFQKYLQRRLSQ
ncbi:Thioredoxin-related protein [Thalassovita gelatinovora]|uniref:Thioredoxin-related protein n=1 Tax=Thalassovita gelatinovora TaxID=53501 RepID=A0A0P1FY08_THAGE|nr:thioredoxin family protein [Thalassovita gelatinovora]QIZ79928.1 thioredoxin fold domain-containing protein [Thalassovita gelatinovora]CUH66443.1 Thioredoxin-related protein [Thalassovita gelatinovora]SER13959.1 Thioredoxin-related protein [Thalassovita gelatinovora]